MKQISVIITTHNRQKSLEQAIESVLKQRDVEFEIIVVDDCPQNPARIEHNPFIKIIRNEKNLGGTKSLNVGLNNANGKYIAILDDDDIWIDKYKLKKQFDFLEANPDYMAVGTNAISITIENGEIIRKIKTDYPQTDKEIRSQMLLNDCMPHVASMYRNIIRYDETFKRSKDWELFLRLGRLGKLANLPDITTLFYEKRDMKLKMIDSYWSLRVIWKHRRNYHHFLRAFFNNIFRFGVFGVFAAMPVLYGAYRGRKTNED